MTDFEMIEKLVEKENVSFEEARDALRAADGDLVDAVVYLERKAKEKAAQPVEAGEQTSEPADDNPQKDRTYSNTADSTMNMAADDADDRTRNMTADDADDQMKEEESMKEETGNSRNKKNSSQSIRNYFRKAKNILVYNSLSITRNGEEKGRIPAWLLAIILVCCFRFSVAVLIVSLFLGFRYSFVGKDDLSKANEVMDKAGDIAENLKTSLS